MKNLFTLDRDASSFSTKKEACSYARTISLMHSLAFIVVRYDGFAIETFKQGKRIKRPPIQNPKSKI